MAIQSTVQSENILNDLNFCVIDLETTGGNHKYDKIIEIGLVKIKNLEVQEKKEFLINPEIPIPQFIQKLTNINEDDIKTAPRIEEVIQEILEFIDEDILVAHNISFDIPFLNSVLKRLKIPALKNRVLCTNVMTKYLVPEMMNSNLRYLCDLFEIEHVQAHRALSDAHSTALLLLKYLDIYIQKGIKKVNQIYYPKNKFELDRIHFDRKTPQQTIYDVLESSALPLTITLKGSQGVINYFIPFSREFMSTNQLLPFLESDWSRITLTLHGSFFQCLIRFKDFFLNIPKENRDSTLQFLESIFSIDKKAVQLEKSIDDVDFIVVPHLVRGQFVIYNRFKISNKNALIFKYPGHEKKLEQFVRTQKNKMNEKKKKGFPQNESLQQIYQFLNSFITVKKDSQLFSYFSRKEIPLQTPKHLDKFFQEKIDLKNGSSFPRFHF
ncbi:MAG: 3'-5' exonuclease [Halobacteriovoraceae bacterium]|nr:3'-5' exonuclease [Halobacteriovoraceae bacterium]MCB9093969.1 3'-5' exonuclease [Halobacteriovoraceae bacterium]